MTATLTKTRQRPVVAKPKTQTLTTTKGRAVAAKYSDLVREGKAAKENVEQGQWKLGDLALLVCPSDGTNPTNHSIREYAQDVGINVNTLRGYRKTAEAWPPSDRSESTSFTVHEVLAANPNRVKLIKPKMTKRDAINIGRKERGLLPLAKDPDVTEVLITAPVPGTIKTLPQRPKVSKPTETPEERLERLTDELHDLEEESDLFASPRVAQPDTPAGNAARKAEGLFAKTEHAGATKSEADSAFAAARALVEKHKLVIRCSVEGGE